MNFSAFFCTFSANYCWTPAKGSTFLIFAASLLCVCNLASITSSLVTCTKMLMLGWDLSGQLGLVTGVGVLFMAWSPGWIWTWPDYYVVLVRIVLVIQRKCHEETVWHVLNKLSGLISFLTQKVLHSPVYYRTIVLVAVVFWFSKWAEDQALAIALSSVRMQAIRDWYSHALER